MNTTITTPTKPAGSLTAEEFKARCEANEIHYVFHRFTSDNANGTNIYFPLRETDIPDFRKWFCDDLRCVYAIQYDWSCSDAEFIRRIANNFDVIYEGNADFYEEVVAHANEVGTSERHIFWWR